MKKDEFHKIIEERNRRNKFYNKSVNEKEILLVEYLTFDEKKKYEELKKNFEKDETGEISYELSHLLRTAARYHMEKDHPRVPLCQWFMYFEDGPANKYIEISKNKGHIHAFCDWCIYNEQKRSWEDTKNDYEMLVLNHNCGEAAERLGYLYLAHDFIDLRAVCPQKDYDKALYWFNKAIELGYQDAIHWYESTKEKIEKEEQEKKEREIQKKLSFEENVKKLNYNDKMFINAVRFSILNGNVSCSYLQRRLNISFSRAAQYIDLMKDCGFVEIEEFFCKHWKVILTPENFEKIFSEKL